MKRSQRADDVQDSDAPPAKSPRINAASSSQQLTLLPASQNTQPSNDLFPIPSSRNTDHAASQSSEARRLTVRSSQSDDEREILAGTDDARHGDLYDSDDSLDQLDPLIIEAKRRKSMNAFKKADSTSQLEEHGQRPSHPSGESYTTSVGGPKQHTRIRKDAQGRTDGTHQDGTYPSDDSLDHRLASSSTSRRLKTVYPLQSSGSGLRSDRNGRNALRISDTHPVQSLSELIRQRQMQEEKEAEVRQLQQAIADADKADEVASKSIGEDDQHNTNVTDVILRHITLDEYAEDESERVKRALVRTQAGASTATWRFLVQPTDRDGLKTRTGTSKHQGRNRLADAPTDGRQYLAHICAEHSGSYSFMSGFAGDALAASSVPDGWVKWLCVKILEEPQEELSQAQIATLPACGRQLGASLDAKCLQELFQKIGACETAVKYHSTVRPLAEVRGDGKSTNEERAKVRRLLELLEATLPFFKTKARIYLLQVLFKMGIDRELMRGGVQHIRQRLIQQLAEQLGNERVLENFGDSLYGAVEHESLQRRLIESMPDLSAGLHELKRRLALAFVFRDGTVTRIDLQRPSDTSLRIRRWLSEQTAQSQAGTLDMARLVSLVSMLDVGIGEGFPVEGSKEAGSGGIAESLPRAYQGSDGRRSYDTAVDATAESIYKLYVTIMDKGMTDMQRTGVKGVLERIRWRLEHAVRSRAKKRENVLLKQAKFGRQPA